MTHNDLKRILTPALLLPLLACGLAKDSAIKPGEARMSLTVTAPPDGSGRCVEVTARQTVSGRTVTVVSEMAQPGDTTTIAVDAPAGDIELDGRVTTQFDAATNNCGGTTSWFAQKQALRLMPGEERAVTLLFLARAGLGVSTGWEDIYGGGAGGAGGAGGTGGAGGGLPLVNFALNPACSGFPSSAETDNGWGGGTNKCHLIDGLHAYDTWASGLAFTGGHQTAAGGGPYLEPAGVRHAVIDFGAPRTFQKVTIWHHGVEHTPEITWLEYWDGTRWVTIGSAVREYGTMHAEGTNSGYADSDIYTFAPVTGSKVRYSSDNTGNNIVGTYNIHGWLYEFEVWGAPLAVE